MRKLLLFFILGVSLPLLSTYGQDTEKIKPLSIGDTVPDIIFSNIVNYKTSKARLSDFKGKIVILDFWATSCPPCLAMLRVTDSIEKRLSHLVKFLNVTNEEAEKVYHKAFLPMGRQFTSIVGDTLLHRLFPHSTVPHYVWIDTSRIVRAITFKQAVNEASVIKMANGTSTELPEKKDYIGPMESLNRQGILKSGDLVYRSMITEYNPRMRAQDNISLLHPYATTIACVNYSIRSLYQIAYNYGSEYYPSYHSIPNNRTIFQVPDSLRYYTYKTKGYLYCYNLVLPAKDSSSFLATKFAIMQQDLYRTFGLKASLERKMMTCYALVCNDTASLFHPKDTIPYSRWKRTLTIQDQPVQKLAELLDKKCRYSLPIVDQTGLTRKITVRLQVSDWKDLQQLSDVLARYGLSLIKTSREVEILVIKN